MLISIIGVAVVMSLVILSHELGHFFMAKKMGVKIDAFSLGFGPEIWSRKKGDTEYKICLIPLGGYVKMAGEEPGEKRAGAEWEFHSKPVHKRFNIIIAGPIVNYIVGFILFCVIFMIGAPVATSRIGGILEGYPAGKAGLKENDKIIEIDGRKVKYWDEVVDIIHDKNEGSLSIIVDRNGRELAFNVKGRSEEQKDIFGKAVRVTLIGIAYSEEVDIVKHGILKSIEMGARRTWDMTALTYKGIWSMLTGSMSIKGAAGPIGIISMTGRAARKGIVYLLGISALISVSIAIVNLLPLLPLDGGHIFFLGIEKIRRKPVDTKFLEIVQQAGWILLLALLLVISWNDILRFFK